MDHYAALQKKIASKEATVGIIGLGYVGLPLARSFCDGGLHVLGFDVDEAKIEMLANGKNYLSHMGDEYVRQLNETNRFAGTSDFARLGECDAIVVCVPTPLGRHREPDLSYVHNSAELIGAHHAPGALVILESTSFPGTTRDELVPALLRAAAGQGRSPELGRDLFVAFSPEREDPGSATHSTRTIPKLVGGLGPESTVLAEALYEHAVESVVPVTSAEVAEAAKLLENIFRAVNIALVNEMKTVLARMDVDIWEVIRAAGTKPFGFMPFYPGPGLGGHCIPIDPFYMTWKARELGLSVRFIELAGLVNTAMPDFVVHSTLTALNAAGKAVHGSRILVLGLAYKAGIADTRESPSYELIRSFQDMGAHVDYHDPHVPVALPVRKHDLGLESVPFTEESIAGYDAVVISTAHPTVDYALLARTAQIVVDTRNAMQDHREELGDRLVLA